MQGGGQVHVACCCLRVCMTNDQSESVDWKGKAGRRERCCVTAEWPRKAERKQERGRGSGRQRWAALSCMLSFLCLVCANRAIRDCISHPLKACLVLGPREQGVHSMERCSGWRVQAHSTWGEVIGPLAGRAACLWDSPGRDIH